MQDRRSFLVSLGAAALSAACGRAATASRPSRIDRLGVQLYTLRASMAKDVENTLRRVAEIGFREVEFAGYFGKTPQELRAMLDRFTLTAPAAHVALSDLRADLPRALDAARVIGHEYLVVGWLPPEQRRTIADYQRVAQQLSELADRAAPSGVRIGYHNHDFELVSIDGRRPLDVLLDETDAAKVFFEVDLYWLTKGGGDPMAYFNRYAGRIPMVHAKDSAGPPAHAMVEVGQGTIDFARILAAGERVGLRHVFVEHDQPANEFESIAVSYRHLDRILRAS